VSKQQPNYEDMSNRELLESAAELDSEQFNIAQLAEDALAHLEDES
jgi:hypothetical protein